MRNLRAFLSLISLFKVVILIPILTVSFSSTNAWGATVTRGPYLQTGTPTSIVVRWRTDVNTDSRVSYGDNPSNLFMSEVDFTSTTEHEITLIGLTPDTMYYYSIGTTTETLAGADINHYFVTSPSFGTAKPTRIWVIGDSGRVISTGAEAVRDAYISFTGTRPTDIWLMLGDNAYPNGTDVEYQHALFDRYPMLLRNTVVWPTPGNHDLDPVTGTGPYFDMFTLPSGGEAGGWASGTEAYYSFDYGNIHFINLNSEGSDRSPGGAMLTWLQSDLSANIQDWIIAYFHHPPYSKGSHDSDDPADSGGRIFDMRENALPILEAGGVDLVLTGHSHSYERSFLVDGHYDTSDTLIASMIIDSGDGRIGGDGAYSKLTLGPAPNQGAVYAVAGNSSHINGVELNHPVMYISLNVLGSMVLDVNAAELDVSFIDDTGTIRDYFTIVKGAGNPWGITVTPTSGLTTTEAGGQDTFTVVLDSKPTADVTIGLSSDNTTEGTVSPSSLVFKKGKGNWSTPQQVTVTGVDDLVADGDIAYNIVTAAATSTDINYNGFNASDVSVTNNDDETANVIPQAGWSLWSVDSEQNGDGQFHPATNAFDGDVNTFWHTKWRPGGAPGHPHEIQIDLGASYDILGFRQLPRQFGVNGRIGQYEFYVSVDGTNWGTAVATGTFANDALEKEVLFVPTTGQFIRLRALSEVNGGPWTSVAEINVLTINALPNTPPTLSITEPDGAGDTVVVGDPYNITYTLDDPDDVVTVAFFYDTNNLGLDGTAIATLTSEPEGPGVTSAWDTTGVTPDSYFVYGITDDGSGQVSAYSGGQITINATNTPPTLSITEPDGAGDTVVVGDPYNITYTLDDPDDVVTVAFFYDTNNLGLDGTAIATLTSEPEGPGVTSAWDTTGVTPDSYFVYGITDDGSGQVSAYSAGQITIMNVIPQAGWSLWFVDSEQNGDGQFHPATNAFDGDVNTLWHTKWRPGGAEVHPHEIQIDLGASYDILGFRQLPRQFGVNGRIGQYEFYVSDDGINWGTAVATGTFANDALEKEVLFSPTTGQFIRLRALSEVNGGPWTAVAEINALGNISTGNQAPNGVIDAPLVDQTINVGESVNFTGTGTDPDNNLPLAYLWNFGAGSGIAGTALEDPGDTTFNNVGVFTVTFTVTDFLGLSDPTPATRTITVLSGGNVIPQAGWSLWFVDSEQNGDGQFHPASNAFDGDVNTLWHTKWRPGGAPGHPHEIQIDLGASYDIEGLRQLPRQFGENGRIGQYEFYVSVDGTNWGTAVATGTFANDALEKEVLFVPTTGQFIRLRALSEVNGGPWTSVAEINVLGVATP